MYEKNIETLLKTLSTTTEFAEHQIYIGGTKKQH